MNAEQEKNVPKVITPQLTPKQALDTFKKFEDIKNKLVNKETDVDIINGKPYYNKSFWMKMMVVFNLTKEIVDREFYTTENGVRVVGFLVRVKAPNGRSTENYGVCTSSEKWAQGKPMSAMVGMALTRVTNRCIADLIAPGTLPAEEMTEVDIPTKERPNFTSFFRQINSLMTLTVNEAKVLFHKTYHKNIQNATQKELDSFLKEMDKREQEYILEHGGF